MAARKSAAAKGKQQQASAKKALVEKIKQTAKGFDFWRAQAGDKKIVLHIGCGAPNPNKLHQNFRGPDWFELRLDIDEGAKPHIVADMLDMSLLPDKSVDAVWSSHNIEHLYPHDVPKALAEIFRVINDGGSFLVTLPDVQTVANYIAHGKLEEPIYDSPAGPICPIDIFYGHRAAMERGNLFMAHRTGFTAETLMKHLQKAGFTNLRIRRDWVDLWAVGHKYAASDPRRSERVEIAISKRGDKLALPEPMPINRAPHPGQRVANLLSDDLALPPVMYEIIG